MHVTTFKSLISFTLCAVLSMSVVVAIPIKGQDSNPSVAKRLLGDADLSSSSLYRRTKSNPGSRSPSPGPQSHIASSSKPSSGGCTPRDTSLTAESVIIITCQPKAGAAALRPRQASDADFYTRTTDSVQSDDDTPTLEQVDPGLKHRVTSGPTLDPTTCLGKGSSGAVFPDPHNPQQVVKHLTQTGFGFTPGHLRREIEPLKKVQQFIKFEYTTTATNELSEAWVYMHKAPGKSFKELGFRKSGTETGLAEKLLRGSPERATFIDHVMTLTVARIIHFMKELHTKHHDIAPGNVMIDLKEGTTEIKSVELVDWYKAVDFDKDCTPETEAKIKELVSSKFNYFK